MALPLTEQEWFACDLPLYMLDVIAGVITDRKLRLFACHLVERFGRNELRPDSEGLVEIARRCAEGELPVSTLLFAYEHAREIYFDPERHLVEGCLRPIAEDGCRQIVAMFPQQWHRTEMASVLRDIVGSPFHPVSLCGVEWIARTEPVPDCPSCKRILDWNDSAVSRMACHIYDDRAFGEMPILADALEEAGCTEARLLDHLRGPGPHVRGCWALDLLLGKE